MRLTKAIALVLGVFIATLSFAQKQQIVTATADGPFVRSTLMKISGCRLGLTVPDPYSNPHWLIGGTLPFSVAASPSTAPAGAPTKIVDPVLVLATAGEQYLKKDLSQG